MKFITSGIKKVIFCANCVEDRALQEIQSLPHSERIVCVGQPQWLALPAITKLKERLGNVLVAEYTQVQTDKFL
jgi:hypothetical protein